MNRNLSPVLATAMLFVPGCSAEQSYTAPDTVPSGIPTVETQTPEAWPSSLASLDPTPRPKTKEERAEERAQVVLFNFCKFVVDVSTHEYSGIWSPGSNGFKYLAEYKSLQPGSDFDAAAADNCEPYDRFLRTAQER